MSELIHITAGGRPLCIEHAWVGVPDPQAPLLVFLHEGLGSLAMWRDFPERLCRAAGVRGLVYSRPGYGRSTPRPGAERWGLDFMHIQAEQVLPALLDALGVVGPYHLLGHSDGGSISLIHAARAAGRVASCTVMAPHILVEAFGLISIREARRAYLETDLRAKLARYHDDVDSAFWGWNDIWLAPDFPQWQITSELKNIVAPVLAIQGLDDQYGTMAQIDGIAAAHPDTRLLKLPACGHSPHKDQPEAVIDAVSRFLADPLAAPKRPNAHAA
ncbi:alpha/beta fold hydrolase [Ideonella livida]|uniref:Alpha/beta hydrolase n=1 Tax=Ideonella livida TaxID=2707176 RepID=A0A7C9PGK9_9BURK|nr:alpha/beta hydrolase [Ideonella livida]NDY91373.1 alpha/beta hydrolase [Ideonella livida]